MREAAAGMGLRQVVRAPTRGPHLLDLALVDMEGTKAAVLPNIADHSIVEHRRGDADPPGAQYS